MSKKQTKRRRNSQDYQEVPTRENKLSSSGSTQPAAMLNLQDMCLFIVKSSVIFPGIAGPLSEAFCACTGRALSGSISLSPEYKSG